MSLTLKDINPAILTADYAVRGAIVARAAELEKQGREIIYCNIGNPQSLGQKPLTYVRQILSLCEYPEWPLPTGACPTDVLTASKAILEGTQHGLGAYSDSKGVRFIRNAVADFIEARDGTSIDADAIYLTDGASKGAQAVLNLLINDQSAGIMIPIPQYPLYSASITLFGGQMVPYFLDEMRDWHLDPNMLESAITEAQQQGTNVKAICVINPGNPTGAVLDAENIKMIIGFAKRHNLSILADEVYQENIYRDDTPFISFSKVMKALGEKEVSLFSFNSCSKGVLGECGQRGGYLVCENVPTEVHEQLLKLQSIGLCANMAGQVAVYAMVRPPEPGAPSYELYEKERAEIYTSLKARASMLAEGLNDIDGITCNPIAGALYAYPKITLPEGATDTEYCLALLEKTGICVVPGTGFGQTEGTFHFRTTILPPMDQIARFLKLLKDFHKDYWVEHSSSPSIPKFKHSSMVTLKKIAKAG